MLGTPCGAQRDDEVVQVGAADPDAGLRRAVDERDGGALRDEPAPADDDQLGRRQRHLRQQVARHQHGAALAGQALHELPDPDDALRVETVDRLVEEQDAGVAEQGGGDAEPLRHAERERARPPLRDGGEPDLVEDEIDPFLR